MTVEVTDFAVTTYLATKYIVEIKRTPENCKQFNAILFLIHS